MTSFPRLARVQVTVYRIPTDRPESDGTLEWSATTMVLVELEAAGHTGLGYTYADAATASVISDTLAPVVSGIDVGDIARAHRLLRRAVRNLG
jgi:L-alanine-DL-glutamate epimerase-like enolase superfamily enzyme